MKEIVLEEITVENFKTIKSITLRPKKINIFLGENSSGKTNFFKALTLFSNSFMNMEISDKDTFLEKEDKRYIAEKWEEVKPFGRRVDYGKVEFCLREKEDIFKCSGKFLYTDFGLLEFEYSLPILKISENIKNFKSSLIFNNEHFGEEKKEKKHLFLFKNEIIQSLQNKHHFLIFLDKIQPLELDPHLIVKGLTFIKKWIDTPYYYDVNIGTLLDFLKDQHPKQYIKLLEEFESEEGFSIIKKESFKFKKDGQYNSPLVLSHGSLRYLLWLVIKYLPDNYLPYILLVEEIENGIHRNKIKQIMDIIYELATERNRYFFITTHSELWLDIINRYLEEGIAELWIVYRDKEGFTQIKALETLLRQKGLTYEEWVKETPSLTLGDIYKFGLIDSLIE